MTAPLSTSPARLADTYRERFERLVRPAAARQPQWLWPVREAGFARFNELGFPTLRHEDWRFTNVAPLTRLAFRPVVEPGSLDAVESLLGRRPFSGLPGARLVFLNGHFVPSLSGGTVPPGVKWRSLAHALAVGEPGLEGQFGRLAGVAEHGFAAMNAAFFADGACLHVADGVVVEEPLHMIYLGTAAEAGSTWQPRNLLVLGRNSRATVLETHVGVADARYVVNALTECVVGEGATLEHLKYQDEGPEAYHLSSLYSEYGKGSNVVQHSIALGAKLSRNNIRAVLAGEGLECVLNGLYLTRDDQLADHHMVVEHRQPRCASHEYFNGILDDRSKGVFHGRILVHPIAQKTDAKQTNKNLLLSDDATVDTKPQLEIYADDVKCTHGATIGQMDEDSIFYLRARGIGAATARQMLMHAFAGEIIDRVRCEAARQELDRLVWGRLEENPHLRAVAGA